MFGCKGLMSTWQFCCSIFTVTHLDFKRFDVVDIDVSVSQSVNKVSRLKGQRKNKAFTQGKVHLLKC